MVKGVVQEKECFVLMSVNRLKTGDVVNGSSGRRVVRPKDASYHDEGLCIYLLRLLISLLLRDRDGEAVSQQQRIWMFGTEIKEPHTARKPAYSIRF